MSDDDDQKKKDGDNLVTVTGSAIAPPEVMSERQVEARNLRNRVIDLRDRMTDDYFEIGKLLYRIAKENYYRLYQDGDGNYYEKFSDYVEREVDFQFRKAKYLMSIWWWFDQELHDPDVFRKVKEIGWTKAAMLVGVVDTKNVDVWVQKAKELRVKELNEEVKIAMERAGKNRRPNIGDPDDITSSLSSGKESSQASGSEVGAQNASPTSNPQSDKKADFEKAGKAAEPITHNLDGSPRTAAVSVPAPMTGAPESMRTGVDPLADGEKRLHRTRWTVIMDGEEKEIVETAIDVASRIAGVENDGKGYLLSLVATTFLATYNGISYDNERQLFGGIRQEVLSCVEKAFGIDLISLDKKTGEVVYGSGTVDKLASEVEEDASE